MSKIISLDQISQLVKKLEVEQKKIVLAGGCFDVLHIGHINFLQRAKEQGDILIVLLESDETIKKLKGNNRPVNTQEDRAVVLNELKSVNYIVLLPKLKSDKDYDLLVKLVKPAIIATTKGDVNIVHKNRQAKEVGAKVIVVNKPITDRSTTRIAKLLSEEI